MPELPEVETVRRGLAPVLEGHQIVSADIRRPDLRWPFPPNMSDRLTGASVTRLGRRSKYLLAELSTGETLLAHLGMSGRFLISGQVQGAFHHDHPAPEKHDHVILETSAGIRIAYNDPRRFGAMDLTATDQLEKHRWLRVLGPEPLGNDFHEAHLVAAFRGRNTPVKSALLDQGIVAGLGNIYVSEALHRAGISPLRKAGQISASRIAKLIPIVRVVLQDAIEAGGSSLRDHRQVDGDLGYFQHRFRAYDRAGEPCQTPDCKGEIARIVQSGRATFYCRSCQR